jgi:putative DNA primase/helicase
MTKKLPQTLDGHIAEAEEAIGSGAMTIDEFRKPKLIAIGINDFLLKKLPPREFIIQPCLPKQGLVMIYAKRGVGKTYFALFLACKIASGASLFGDKWKIGKQWRVLYIDGEMPANAMQERLKTLMVDSVENCNLSIITRDAQTNGMMPNLATDEGQTTLEPHIQNADVIIVDNLSTLTSHGKENEAASWDPIANWALRLRSIGKSIIFIHHAGKNNEQRGTSKKEDILDTVINLKHPSDYDSKQGARFEIHFEKSRGFAGEDSKPFEVKLHLNDNQASWEVSDLEDLEEKRVVELASGGGLSQRDIAHETGLSLSKVNRVLKKFKE